MKMEKYFGREGVGKIYDATKTFVQKHPVATAVGVVAGSALLNTALNIGGYGSPMLNYPYLRFVPELTASVGCAECNIQRVRNEKGRDLTLGEKMTSALYGGVAPLILWEGWEEVGSTGSVYNFLRGIFGDLAKQDFPGKGSYIDLGLVTAGTMAIESAKEVIRKGARAVKGHFSK